MRKYAEKLVASSKNMMIGNHSVMFTAVGRPMVIPTDDGTGYFTFYANRVFLYHGNIIFVVNDGNMSYTATHAGWNTSSTSQALNQYRKYFNSLGYKNI